MFSTSHVAATALLQEYLIRLLCNTFKSFHFILLQDNKFPSYLAQYESEMITAQFAGWISDNTAIFNRIYAGCSAKTRGVGRAFLHQIKRKTALNPN